ncbi:MAG: HEAT repeat domain-containing protein [Melioribacteraceae bacterium]
MLAKKIKNIIQSHIILITLSLLLLQSCSSVRVISDESFNKISNYEYGQSRNSLTDFSNMVNSLAKTEENRELAEENILDFLKTDATFASKQFVCRELRIIGSEKSVEVLSEMLLNEKTTNIAKYALENIPGSKVDDALIEMLPKADKSIQLGIINSLATRKSEASVPSISKLLASSNSDIANTAASALGKIGNDECINYLAPYLDSKNNIFRNIVLDSYLLCADELLKHNKREEANNIYEVLYNKDVPLNIREASLIGIINSTDDKTKEILSRIKSIPNELKFIPISKIRELPESTNLLDFAKLLPALESENQIQLLSVFEDRKDKRVKSFVLKSLNSSNTEVRIASIRTIANIGDETDIIALATIAANETGEISRHSRASLGLLKGNQVDQAILLALPKSEGSIKIELIRTIGARNISSAFNTISTYTKSENKKIRSATFRTLEEISTAENVEDLVKVLFASGNNSDSKRIERTISKVLVKYPENKNTNLLLNKFDSTSDVKIKSSLLRLLGFTSGAKILQILRNELTNKNEEIKIAAVSGITNWKTSEPLDDLMQFLTSAQNEKVKSNAFKGSVKFISMDNKLDPNEKVNLYKEVLPFAKTSNELNLILDEIGHTDSFESLEVIKPFINRPDLKETVDDCINRVSWHLHQDDPERVKEYVQWFLSKIKDERFQTKNTHLLEVIDRYITSKKSN